MPSGMRCFAACSAVLVCGCGRIAFDPTVDAAADTLTACEHAWLAGPHLTAPQPIATVNTPTVENAPALSPDGLTLYFATGRSGNTDIYFVQRSALDQPFGVAMPYTAVNTMADEAELRFSPSGLEIWVSTDRTGGAGDFDLWRATRDTVDDPFGALAPVPEINSTGAEYNAEVSRDGLRMFFAALGRPGNIGQTDIWHTERASVTQPFDPPVLVTSLSTAQQDAGPTLTASERIMLFTRGPGPPLDIWYATRADPSATFTVVGMVADLATGSSFTPFLRPDGCEVFLSNATSGQQDVYVSTVIM